MVDLAFAARGVVARRLTGPVAGRVAEPPDVDLRRTARSRHQAKPNNEFGRNPAHAVPNWQAPTSTRKPAGHRRVARWRVGHQAKPGVPSCS